MKRIIALAMIAAFVLALCSCADKNGAVQPDTSLDYNGLFDTNVVHEVRVEISDADWADLKANPLDKTKYHASITIDGNTVGDVSFATKGNTSLSQVASTDSDRYSFKINFGKFVDGQTYFGLDKLNLNNLMSDATYMKDYLSYTIMREAGVNAPLVSYARLYVNGELHGLYIAIEDVSDSFLTRNYGDDDGALYKPETGSLDIGDKPQDAGSQGEMPAPGFDPGQGDMPMPSFDPGQGDMPMPSFDPGQGGFPNPGGSGSGGMQFPGGAGGSSQGADLVYTDDDPDSYPDIFDNNENKVTDEDKEELVAAIKALSTGVDIAEYWDIDQIARYFAAHNFVLNYDSYTGTMLHNYYLYERGGSVTVFPWDYNLAFCGFMGSGNASASVNTPIDSPLSGASEEARPLWNAIVSNEEFLELYHKYFSELISGFFESGKCADEIERVRALISPCVKSDPTAFYTFDQFSAAVDTLAEFVKLRAESVRKQLDGGLGSTSGTQSAEDMVDASGLDLASMGSFGGGQPGQQGGFPGGQPGQQGGFPGGFPGGQPGQPGGFPGSFPGGQPGQPQPTEGNGG